MDLKKIFADALAELPKDASAEQLVAYIEAKADAEKAIEGQPEEPAAEADMSADGQEPSKEPDPADANPGAPSALAEDKPKGAACADVPLADPPAPPPAEGAGGVEPNAQPSQGGDPAVAAAEECFGMIKQATGMDDAAALAWCRENMDKIAALAGQGAGAPMSDAPAVAALTRDLRVADGQVAALTAKLAEYEAKDETLRAEAEKAKRTAAETQVDALITSGRALDTMRDDLVGIALENPARFEKLAKSMPQVVPTARIAASADDLDKSGAEDLTGVDEKWLQAFDVQLRSTIPNAKDRRALAVKAFRERMEFASDLGAKPNHQTNGRA